MHGAPEDDNALSNDQAGMDIEQANSDLVDGTFQRMINECQTGDLFLDVTSPAARPERLSPSASASSPTSASMPPTPPPLTPIPAPPLAPNVGVIPDMDQHLVDARYRHGLRRTTWQPVQKLQSSYAEATEQL